MEDAFSAGLQCASVRMLQTVKDVTPETARKIRRVWLKYTREQLCDEFPACAAYVRACYHPPGTRALRRMAIDSLLGTYGVEYLGYTRRNPRPVHYCNAGDTYAHTVLFTGSRLWCGNWGDLVEHRSIREPT